tara:strand:+ start:16857 stop:17066 length:210 start_codon:yes stop_codon:yes gene_type:complete
MKSDWYKEKLQAICAVSGISEEDIKDVLYTVIDCTPQEHGKGKLSEYLTTNEITYIVDGIIETLTEKRK